MKGNTSRICCLYCKKRHISGSFSGTTNKVRGVVIIFSGSLGYNQSNIGGKITFSKKLLILQEGQIRYDNLIPPGFRDSAKVGEAKYGDLFVWKDIIAIAKEKNTNIIFVCNDTKGER